MASISSAGIGSGLDVNSLVSQLVAAERAPRDAALTRVDVKTTTELTAVSQVKGGLSTFQTALAGLKTASSLIARKAAVSDDTVFSASASGTAPLGNYDVQVVQLAKAAQLATGPFVGGAASTVGTGTLTLSVGGNSFNVVIDATNNSLSGVRDAINSAAGNTGVRASLLNAVDGSRLVLTADKTGAATAISVAQGAGGTLDSLIYDAGSPTPGGMTQISAAQDAIVNIAGFAVHSASNSIDGAIDGVVLNLKKPSAVGTSVTMNISADDAAVTTKVNDFVTAYNTLAKQLAGLRSYDPATQKAGPLLGDSLLLGIEASLRKSIVSPVTGAVSGYPSLNSIGITFGADGSLAVDAAKLQKAMSANSGAVGALFAGTGGVATQLDKYINDQLASGGGIASRTTSIDKQRKDLNAQKAALDARMAVVQARYQKQFSALDTMLSQMQSTSNYLTQQLAQSTNIAKSAGG